MDPGSVILNWNNIYLDLVRKIGGAPGPLARIGGLMHWAMYEAVNRLTPGSPYPNHLKAADIVQPLTPTTKMSGQPIAPGQATASATAAFAACYVLTESLKQYVRDAQAMQGGALNPFDPFQVSPGAGVHITPETLSVVTPGNATTSPDSEAYGRAIAMAVVKAHDAHEGFDPAPAPPFTKLKPGEWRPTGSGAALTPNWGKVPLLFGLNPTDYEPTDLRGYTSYAELLKSDTYARNLAEVQRLGAADSVARSREQTEIAFFWANDLNGTSKPPGQLYTITQIVAKQQGTLADEKGGQGADSGLLKTARLFAMVGTAMLNASVVAWRAKYFLPDAPKNEKIRLWRPETAIQLASDDGNPGTAADANWQPLSAMSDGTRFSPNFPAYVSGHSTFGAAHAAAMRTFFGRDTIAFTATTEDPHALRDANGIRLTRRFQSFTQAAMENGRSRVYLGVHYQFDADGGYETGTKVGLATAELFI